MGVVSKENIASKVLTAAGTLFAQQGYEGTSFKDITVATGAQRTLILYHYKSKDELWRRAMLLILERFNTEIAARTQTPPIGSDEELIRKLMSSYLDAMLAVPEYGQVLMREGVNDGPRLAWLTKYFQPAFVRSLSFVDREIEQRLSSSMLRMVVLGSMFFATALAPLAEASLSGASGERTAGISPLTGARRKELIDLVAGLILRA